MNKEGEISFESTLLRIQGGLNTVEAKIVSFFPYAPSSNSKDFHEHGSALDLLCLTNHLRSISLSLPCHSDYVPARNAKRAVEEEMLQSFFRGVGT